MSCGCHPLQTDQHITLPQKTRPDGLPYISKTNFHSIWRCAQIHRPTQWFFSFIFISFKCWGVTGSSHSKLFAFKLWQIISSFFYHKWYQACSIIIDQKLTFYNWQLHPHSLSQLWCSSLTCILNLEPAKYNSLARCCTYITGCVIFIFVVNNLIDSSWQPISAQEFV